MTLRTHSLVEWDHNIGVEERHELRLVLRQTVVGGDLEYRVDEDAGQRPPQLLVVPPDHRQEVADQIGTGVQLDVGGEHEVRGGGESRHVPRHVDWIVKPQPVAVRALRAVSVQALGVLTVLPLEKTRLCVYEILRITVFKEGTIWR